MVASFLALMLLIAYALPPGLPDARAEVGGAPALSSLAVRLQQEPTAVVRGLDGEPTTMFGLPFDEARMLLLPVNRERALPDRYEPPDLIGVGGHLVREILRPDLIAMIEAADAEDVELAPVSGFRSPDEQALAFEASVWQAMARAGGEIDRAEAENRSARFVAPPGHSQHQLGTAVDFSTWEINYAVQPQFAETAASRWLEQHAWQYGFVLAYTRHGEGRSGYAFEPWHYRWIGRELAAVLHHDGYLHHPTLIVDDYLRAAEELIVAETGP